MMKEYNDDIYGGIITIVEALARCTSVGIAVIDMDEENFVCVSDNYVKLAHSSVECAKEKGFHWFDDAFDQESIRTLKAIDLMLKNTISDGDVVLEENFTFSCVLRLKNVSTRNALVQYSVTPICTHLDNRFNLMLATMQYTHFKDSGHLNVATQEGVFLYDSVTNVWTKYQPAQVSDADSDLLAFSLRGFSGKEIAEKKCVSDEAVKSQKSRMYMRWGVSSMEEAIGKLFNMGMQRMHWIGKRRKD